VLEWWHYVDANFMFMCIFCSLCKLRVYSFCEFLCSVARSMAELSYPINLLNKYVFVYVKQQLLDRCCAVCSSQGSWRENESAVAWIRISNCKSMTIVFLFPSFYAFDIRHWRRRHCVFGLSVRRVRPSVRSSGQISLPRYVVNALSHLDETYREYSLAPTDTRIRFWRSKVKGHSRPSRWRRHPRRRCSVEVHFLVCF